MYGPNSCRRDRKLDRAVERGNAHFAAEHRLVERDRQLQAQVGAIGLNSGCGATLTVISASPGGPAALGQPWPFSRICWPVAMPAGILTSTSLPVGKWTRVLVPLDGIGERDRQRRMQVLSAGRRREILGFESAPATPRPPRRRTCP